MAINDQIDSRNSINVHSMFGQFSVNEFFCFLFKAFHFTAFVEVMYIQQHFQILMIVVDEVDDSLSNDRLPNCFLNCS